MRLTISGFIGRAPAVNAVSGARLSPPRPAPTPVACRRPPCNPTRGQPISFTACSRRRMKPELRPVVDSPAASGRDGEAGGVIHDGTEAYRRWDNQPRSGNAPQLTIWPRAPASTTSWRGGFACAACPIPTRRAKLRLRRCCNFEADMAVKHCARRPRRPINLIRPRARCRISGPSSARASCRPRPRAWPARPPPSSAAAHRSAPPSPSRRAPRRRR